MMRRLFITLIMAVGMSVTGMAQTENDKFVPTQEELDKYLPELTVGDTVPELKAPDRDGKVYDIKDMRGSYVVIDFWATWCGDCRREIPGLKALYADFKDVKPQSKDIIWLGFSFDFNREAWTTMLDKEQMPWIQISNMKKTREDPTFSRWKLRWIPAFFVIKPDGTIAGTAITADGLRKVLETL